MLGYFAKASSTLALCCPCLQTELTTTTAIIASVCPLYSGSRHCAGGSCETFSPHGTLGCVLFTYYGHDKTDAWKDESNWPGSLSPG